MKDDFRQISRSISEAIKDIDPNRVGGRAFAMIRERTARGQFLGGSRAGRGYSTRDLSIGKLGDVTYNAESQSVSIKRVAMAPVRISKEDLKWSNKGGRLVGGYKKFRQLAGRKVDKVDLTLSGRMMNSFRFDVERAAGEVTQIVFGVSPSQDEKAFQTNEQRQWLCLSDSEMDVIEKDLESMVMKGLG